MRAITAIAATATAGSATSDAIASSVLRDRDASGLSRGGVFALPPGAVGNDPLRQQSLQDMSNDTILAQQLEFEAYGLQARDGGPDDDDFIRSRYYGSQCVHFLYDQDIDLFDQVLAFRDQNPASSLIDAVNQFSEKERADVMAKIVYATDDSHYDAVIEYSVHDDSEEHDRKLHRTHFERELLRHHLILVRERSNGDLNHLKTKPKSHGGKKVTGTHHLKLLISFHTLCVEAESIQLTKPMVNKATHAFSKANEILPNRFKPSRSHTQMLESASSPEVNAVDKDIEFSAMAKFKHDVVAIADMAGQVRVNLWSIVQFAFVIVPDRVSLETHPFEMTILHKFVGGDSSAPGSSPAAVQLNFFSTMQRTLLLNIVVNRCKIRLSTPRPVGINDLLVKDVYDAYFAVHDGPAICFGEAKSNARKWLFDNWAKFEWKIWKLFPFQPMREIRDYFGEYVAMYFAWLGFYTIWLFGPAVLGLIATIYILVGRTSPFSSTSASTFNFLASPVTVAFAFFMSLWGVLFLRFWKRRSISLSTVWDVRDLQREESRRAEFYGTKVRKDPVTGRKDVFMPWTTAFRLKFMSFTAVLFAVIIMLGFQVLIIWLHAKFSTFNMYVSTIVSSLISLANIVILTPAYIWLAMSLTRFENHRTQLSFENYLLIKNFVFTAIQNYSSLIYAGIIKVFAGSHLDALGVPAETCIADSVSSNSCGSELAVSMAVIFVGLQFISQFQAVLLPLVSEFFKQRSLAKGGAKSKKEVMSSSMPQHILDSILVNWVRRDEFTNKMIEFGFLTMFSTAFPLAPVFALASNVLEVRFAAYRLVFESKRPIAIRAHDIGAWMRILEVLADLSVLVNACVIAFSSGWFEDVVVGQWFNVRDDAVARMGLQLAFVLVFQRAVAVFATLADWSISAEPKTIHNAIEREKYLMRVANGDIVEMNDLNDEELAKIYPKRKLFSFNK
ncbi:Anoctamin-7 [Entophlyctis sp. JEL0112]|nr:Anoctamin-7 [Entophlyctis sp. JEL0112]